MTETPFAGSSSSSWPSSAWRYRSCWRPCWTSPSLYVVAVAFLGIDAAAYWNSLDDVVMAGLASLMFGAIAVILVVNG